MLVLVKDQSHLMWLNQNDAVVKVFVGLDKRSYQLVALGFFFQMDQSSYLPDFYRIAIFLQWYSCTVIEETFFF